ncbi:MAG: hypothetical protein GTO02_10575 [Candidatus Dadabacteria bacterium]|nr:hypothetical protein [Candidatus Dadabacteria bacterium]
MDSCHFVNQYRSEDQEIVYHTCGSRVNVREIEFKNPDYRELNKTVFVCESHFQEVFGDIIEEERKARRDADNAKTRYNRDQANAQKQAEYWNPSDFKEYNYPKVQRAFDHWKKVRKEICRYEACDADLKSLRKVWMIRVYTATGREWQTLFFCSSDHVDKIKRRIGLIKIEKKKGKATSLDTFMEN